MRHFLVGLLVCFMFTLPFDLLGIHFALAISIGGALAGLVAMLASAWFADRRAR